MTDPIAHADRGHSQWSASSTARNFVCSGAIALQALAGDEKESEHAARGTACHTVSEDCLNNGTEAMSWLGRVVKTKEHEIEIDEEIIEGAAEYVEYVRNQISVYGNENIDARIFIEEHFSLAALDPPMEAGGTCDAVLHQPSERLLEVIDLKFGRGVVDVDGNPQLRTYALGALLAFPELEVDRIKVTIVQPRAPVRGETIRSETFHVADLISWTDTLLKAMKKSAAALAEFDEINGSRVLFDEWATNWLTPGACKFCKAEGFCPAVKNKALAVAPEQIKLWFEDPTAVTKPDLKNQPELLGPEELGHALDGLEMLEDWIKALRAYAHRQAELGNPPVGYQLADKIGNRCWTEDDEAVLARILVVGLKIPDDQIFVKKLKSPAMIEKIVGAKRKAEVDALCHKPVKGTNLVSSAKSTRPPAKSKVESMMEEVKE